MYIPTAEIPQTRHSVQTQWRNEQWLDKNRGRSAEHAQGRPAWLLWGAAKPGSCSLLHLSCLLLPACLELNENKVTVFLGVQAALHLNKTDEQIHQRKLTLGEKHMGDVQGKAIDGICYLISLS